MVSGEKFIDEEGRAQINSKYEPLTVDMETAGVAHACYVNNIPFLAVRTVTDTAANSGTENFDKNCAAAALITKDVMLELLKEIESGIC